MRQLSWPSFFLTLILIGSGFLATANVVVMTAKADTRPSFEEPFRAGLAAYQTKDYEKARGAFEKAVEADRRNTAAMANLALSYYQAGDKGRAIAWFRRVLGIDPSNPEARAGLRYAISQLEIKEIPHRLETFETLRENVLEGLSLRQLLSLTGLLLLSFGWLFLGWLGQRRRALKTQEASSPFPVGVGFLALLFIIFAFLLTFKIYDLSRPRATIVGGKVEARTLPGENGVVIFELHEGFEVFLHEVEKNWVQVTYPGGQTGWIPKANVIPSQEGEP